jgi:hypothetical protein
MQAIKDIIRSSNETKERKHGEVVVKAFDTSGEHVATFQMGLSVKVQG